MCTLRKSQERNTDKKGLKEDSKEKGLCNNINNRKYKYQ